MRWPRQKDTACRAATLRLLSIAEGSFDDMARYGRPTPELQYQKALMLIQFAHNYAMLGDTGKQLAHAEDAYRLLAGLAAARPDDSNYQDTLAAAFDEIGNVQAAQGDFPTAFISYRHSLAIRKHLAQSHLGSAGWQLDLATSHEMVGNAEMAVGDLTAALKSFLDSLAIRQRDAQSDPANGAWHRDLSISYEKVGDVQVVQGNLAAAVSNFLDSLAIRQRLAQSDPSNTSWQRDLSISFVKIGTCRSPRATLRPR